MTKSELCLQCLKCCKQISFMVPASGEALAYYKVRRIKVRLIPLSSEMWVTVPYVCPHLTDKGCDIYEDRPLACSVFDGLKQETTRDFCLWKELKND